MILRVTQTTKATLATLLFMICATLLAALTLTGPSWSPTSPYTNDTLNCSWGNTSDTIAENITILKNNVYFNSTYVNATDGDSWRNTMYIHPDNTTKADKWTCRVTLYSLTGNATTDINVTILNSAPTTEGLPAGIFDTNNNDIGYIVQIDEDETMLIDVNATDADDDTITYLSGEEFCTRLSSTAGTYSCTPTQSYLDNNTPTQVNITFTLTDGQNVGGRTVTINITPVNDVPVINVTNQTTAVNASLNVTFNITDVENNVRFNVTLIVPSDISDKMSITRLDTNGTLISVYYDGSTPDFSDVGLWNITINVTDNSTHANGTWNNVSGLYNYTFNITPAGRRPFFMTKISNISNSSGPYNITQGETIQINITANDSDENTTITFSDNTTFFNISTVTLWTNTSAAFGQINFTPGNNDVGVYTVNITITDAEGLTNSTLLFFNVSNFNDAPTINELSANSSNTQNNTNITNLTAYEGVLFTYFVNATDPDTIHGDNLTYYDNTSLFDINTTTGLINFTPSAGQVQAEAYHINITVNDTIGNRTNRTLVLFIRANVPPVFNATLTSLNCTSRANCSRSLGEFSTDADNQDFVFSYNISFVTGNLSSFAFNSTTGFINFTTLKTDVGNYTVNVTITDTHGAQNSTLMNITINNTAEAPNLTRFNFSNETIVAQFTFTYTLNATDDDFLVSSANESLNFTTNLSIAHNITLINVTNITAIAIITFTPSISDVENYTIRINVTDRFGLVDQKNITFQVLPKAPAPNITTVTPWGGNNTTSTAQTSYLNATNFSNNITYINITENQTILFNASVNDTRPLVFRWTVNDTEAATTQNYSRVFNFFSAGRYIIVLNVTNDRYESSFFTWNVSVLENNRPPQLTTNLTTPVTVNGTLTSASYFTLSNGTKFIDPDDDLDSGGTLNGNETNTLTFSTASSCSVATISISGADLTVTGSSIGSCNVTFNATDTDGLSIESGSVTINVTGLTSTTTTTTSSSGGGSLTSTYLPITKAVDKPRAFTLITPKLVTIYNEKELKIPIVINNTWNGTLNFVTLNATSNATGVTTSIDVAFFEQIPQGEFREATLTVTGYRLGENYEVLVLGAVSDPEYTDDALILLNSIEQSSAGQETKIKISFATDLLNQHPECVELNEVLIRAQQQLDEGNVEDAKNLVDGAINGCKYLVGTQQRVTEQPGLIKPVIKLDEATIKTLMYGLLAFVVVSSIAFLVYYHYSHKPEEDI